MLRAMTKFAAMATSKAAVERLWEVCQVPDYRKIAPATHAELAVTLYGFLMREGKIPDDWFAAQVAQADRTDGDIDTLSNRIAHVRTWTFVANRPDWLADPEHWQAVARSVEDKLSDALHERLTERFVDRRTSVLMRRLRENTTLETEIKKTGEVVVEGHEIGRLDGFTFVADASAAGSEAKTLQGAARSALAGEIDARAIKLTQAPDREFVLSSDGSVRWTGAPVGKLIAGDDVLRPRIRVIADEQLTGASREAVQTRLDLWLKNHIERLLGPLFSLGAAEDITGIARGVAYQLIESIGVLERQKVAEEVKGLDQPSRATLRKYGVRFGAYHLYLPALLKPAPRSLAAQLWMLKHGGPDDKGLDELQRLAVQRPHLDPDRQGNAEAALPHHRLSGLRRARHPRRHPGAAGRSDPPGAGVARRRQRRQARGRDQRLRLHRHRRDDVADRRVRRGFRLDPALARLSHGPAAQTAGAGEAAGAEKPASRRLPHPKLRRRLHPMLRPPTPSPGSMHRRSRPTPSPSRKHRRSKRLRLNPTRQPRARRSRQHPHRCCRTWN